MKRAEIYLRKRHLDALLEATFYYIQTVPRASQRHEVLRDAWKRLLPAESAAGVIVKGIERSEFEGERYQEVVDVVRERRRERRLTDVNGG